jgi:rhodanese-related sulfurtransferase
MVILDVREKEEFQAEHIPESICCPLSQFDLMIPGILKHLNTSEEVIVMCRSGNRAKMAINELKKYNVDLSRFKCFEGGILQWKAQGNNVKGSGAIFPIMRQVQIVASSLIFLAFALSRWFSPDFVYLALFVGVGLAIAGYTGFCPMVQILQKMPWNNRKPMDCENQSKPNCCG